MVEWSENGVTVVLNIKNAEVEQLAADVARLAKESKTKAIRLALCERKERLLARGGRTGRQERLTSFLRDRVWPQIPPEMLHRRITKRERGGILGYGAEGF